MKIVRLPNKGVPFRQASARTFWLICALSLCLGLLPALAAAQKIAPRADQERLRLELARLKRQLSLIDSLGKSDFQKELRHLTLEARKVKLEIDMGLQSFRDASTESVKTMKISLQELNNEALEIFQEINKVMEGQREAATQELAALEKAVPVVIVPERAKKIPEKEFPPPPEAKKEVAKELKPKSAIPLITPQTAFASPAPVAPPPPPLTKKEAVVAQHKEMLEQKTQQIETIKQKLQEPTEEGHKLLLQLGNAYLSSQDYLRAIDPAAAEQIIDSDQFKEMKSGGYEAAIIIFKTALAQEPRDPYTNFLVGDAYNKIHDGQSALNYMEKARRLYLEKRDDRKVQLVGKIIDALSHKYAYLQICTTERRGAKNCG
jgi:tetratricopeptide (TPR) repeat protein